MRLCAACSAVTLHGEAAVVELVIPQDYSSSRDLPAICVVTGETEGVSFHHVRLRAPAVGGGGILLRGVGAVALFAATGAHLSHAALTHPGGGDDSGPQSWVCELPFTKAAFDAWERAQTIAMRTTVGGAILSAIGVAVSIAVGTSLEAVLGVIGSILLLFAFGLAARRSALAAPGPRCITLGRENLVIDIPSATAAETIARHLEKLKIGAIARDTEPRARGERCPVCRASNRWSPGALRICIRCGARDD